MKVHAEVRWMEANNMDERCHKAPEFISRKDTGTSLDSSCRIAIGNPFGFQFTGFHRSGQVLLAGLCAAGKGG
jgi:hypothetical protein